MPNRLLLALTGLLFANIQAIRHVGGLDSGSLLGIYASLLLTGACLGPSAWRPAPRADSFSQLAGAVQDPPFFGRAAFLITTLMYGLALIAAVVISPVPALMSEEAAAMCLLPLGYMVARAVLRAGICWERLWSVFRLTAIILAVMALGERLLTGARAYTLFSDPNVLAGLFNVFVVTQFAQVAERRRQGETALPDTALLFLFSAAQGATGSLSGLLCLLTALLPLTLFATRGLAATRAAPVLAVAAGAALLAFVCSSGTVETPGAKLQGISQHSSFTVRLEMARSSLAIYRDSPWYGSGLGSYKIYYPRYRSQLDTGTTGDLAHNDYVEFLQEGGPLLCAGLLALALLVAARTAQAILKGWRQGPTSALLAQAGTGCALLALLLHAGMNFIFYVAPMAFLFGVLLARLAPAVAPRTSPPTSGGQLAVFASVLMALAVALLATLGARALFLSLTRETCELQACTVLRGDVPFVKSLTAYLAGTQPTWVPTRDYLIANYLKTEQTITGIEEKRKWRIHAFHEVSTLVEDVPEISSSYVKLAELITRDASLATLMPSGLPHEPENLYRLALAHNPLDLRVRLQLARILGNANKKADAYGVLEELMPFWNLWEWGDGGRIQLLTESIPLAVSLHKCAEAVGMERSLRALTKMQEQIAAAGTTLPSPPNSLAPPTNEKIETSRALAATCN